jgi:hypothetical protein
MLELIKNFRNFIIGGNRVQTREPLVDTVAKNYPYLIEEEIERIEDSIRLFAYLNAEEDGFRKNPEEYWIETEQKFRKFYNKK